MRLPRIFVLAATTAALAVVAATAYAANIHASAPAARADGTNRSNASTTAGKTRVYYIAADEVLWNYAPSGMNQITGQPFGMEEAPFVARGPNRIGTTYKKVLYRAYTDGSFTKLQPRPARSQHLGLLGPVIRAEVGDRVRIVFKNNFSKPLTIHVHGLFYSKGSEGTPYADGTSGPAAKNDDAVAPGGIRTYAYSVPERSGPGPRDPSSVSWIYHSHVDEEKEENTGLVGMIVVTRRGMARPDGSPKDVDREFFTHFQIFNENQSLLLDENIRSFAGDPASVNKDDPGFMMSNLKHTINGYIYGNLPLQTMTMKKGERVRWYVSGAGGIEDLHTAHWHGQTTLIDGRRKDVAELLPLTTLVADMRPDDPGIWLYHCHVNGHIGAGMQIRFDVRS